MTFFPYLNKHIRQLIFKLWCIFALSSTRKHIWTSIFKTFRPLFNTVPHDVIPLINTKKSCQPLSWLNAHSLATERWVWKEIEGVSGQFILWFARLAGINWISFTIKNTDPGDREMRGNRGSCYVKHAGKMRTMRETCVSIHEPNNRIDSATVDSRTANSIYRSLFWKMRYAIGASVFHSFSAK